MQSSAKNVDEYLQSLPAERISIMKELRDKIGGNLPTGFEETMQYGMISYVVPHTIYPAGYHCKPSDAVPFISIASQKNHISIYHMAMYAGELLEWFEAEWPKYSSKKLDMGKSCIRFKKPEDIPLDLFGALATKITPAAWIEIYEMNFKHKK